MANPNNRNSVPETTASSLKSTSGLLLTWTAEEQYLLQQGLISLTSIRDYQCKNMEGLGGQGNPHQPLHSIRHGFASEPNLKCCMMIALQLPNKTVREVALRIQWMNKKENKKRRKVDHHLTRKSKDKKGKNCDSAAKSSHFSAQPNVCPYAPAMVIIDSDDGISDHAIGGLTHELLEQNSQALNQILGNLAACKLQDNIKLFCQARDNINKMLNGSKDVPMVMKQMPPFPFKIDEALAYSILPKALSRCNEMFAHSWSTQHLYLDEKRTE